MSWLKLQLSYTSQTVYVRSKTTMSSIFAINSQCPTSCHAIQKRGSQSFAKSWKGKPILSVYSAWPSIFPAATEKLMAHKYPPLLPFPLLLFVALQHKVQWTGLLTGMTASATVYKQTRTSVVVSSHSVSSHLPRTSLNLLKSNWENRVPLVVHLALLHSLALSPHYRWYHGY